MNYISSDLRISTDIQLNLSKKSINRGRVSSFTKKKPNILIFREKSP